MSCPLPKKAIKKMPFGFFLAFFGRGLDACIRIALVEVTIQAHMH
jgi:hypothetical protein